MSPPDRLARAGRGGRLLKELEPGLTIGGSAMDARVQALVEILLWACGFERKLLGVSFDCERGG